MKIKPGEILIYLKKELDRLSEEKASGELVLTHNKIPVTIFLLAGRLMYITDDWHRTRRWKRAIFQHCRDWTPPNQILNIQPWEYDFLYQGLSKSQLSLDKAKLVIKTVAQECLSELALASEIDVEWSVRERVKSTFSYFLSFALADIHPVLIEITDLHRQWHQNGLDAIGPSLSPHLTSSANNINNPTLQLYLNGKFTIWDIALQSKKPIIQVAQALLNWQKKGLIEFKTIADMRGTVEEIVEETPEKTSKTPEPELSSAAKEQGQYLIACIDDSPIVVHNLKSILTPAGFSVLGIQEPMAGFAQLIEHKPDLILLDINMPNANGYSICKFLRETPVFGKTPIVILTAQDNSLDRSRAKMVGANDFLSKPPDPKALINLIHQYLSQDKDNLNTIAT